MHKAVERPQQHGYGQVFDVLGVPEARPVGRQDDSDYPDEPSPPDRDLRSVEHHVGVGQGEPLRHLPYGVYVRHQDFRQLTLRLNRRRNTCDAPRVAPGQPSLEGADARAASQCHARQKRLSVCTSLRVKYTASFAAMLDRNVHMLCVHIDSSLYTPTIQRAKSFMSKESHGTQPQKYTNESRQEPWFVATSFGEEIARDQVSQHLYATPSIRRLCSWTDVKRSNMTSSTVGLRRVLGVPEEWAASMGLCDRTTGFCGGRSLLTPPPQPISLCRPCRSVSHFARRKLHEQ